MVEFILTIAGAILLAHVDAQDCAETQASAVKVERILDEIDRLKK